MPAAISEENVLSCILAGFQMCVKAGHAIR